MTLPNRLAIEMMEDHPDASIEDFIGAIVGMVKRDREGYIEQARVRDKNPNDLILVCLDVALEHLQDANEAMYASFK